MLRWIAGLCLVLLNACSAPIPEQPAQNPLEEQSQVERERAAYDALVNRLELDRSEFLAPDADEHFVSGNRLYWLQSGTFIPKLRSVDLKNRSRVDYAFSIAVDDTNYVYAADATHVVTVTKSGMQLTYRAYQADQPSTLLGEVTIPGPSDEQRWWAYAVSDGAVYIIDTTGDGSVLRWTPPAAQPELLFTLKQAGISLGILWDFRVEGSQMVLIESGRLWRVDLPTRKATFLQNREQTQNASFNERGVVYSTRAGLYFTPSDGTRTRSLQEEIASSTVEGLSGFPISHHWNEEPALLHGTKVLYVGNSGIFEYDLTAQRVRPLLIEPFYERNTGANRIEYRQPQVSPDGDLFVLGLTSPSGSVGADGPIYRVRSAVVP